MVDCWEDRVRTAETLKNGTLESGHLGHSQWIVLRHWVTRSQSVGFPRKTKTTHTKSVVSAGTSLVRTTSALMMNVGEQNGLEAWRLLVRAEHPVSGANRIAAMQSILQYKFSPGKRN